MNAYERKKERELKARIIALSNELNDCNEMEAFTNSPAWKIIRDAFVAETERIEAEILSAAASENETKVLELKLSAYREAFSMIPKIVGGHLQRQGTLRNSLKPLLKAARMIGLNVEAAE